MRIFPTNIEKPERAEQARLTEPKDEGKIHIALVGCSTLAAATAITGYFVFNSQEAEKSDTPAITTYLDGKLINKCSLTFLSDEVAVTAGHCGPEGAEVRNGEKVLGTITENYLVDGAGVDVAFIDLDDNYDTGAFRGPTAFSCVETPDAADAVIMDGAFSGEQAGTVVSAAVKREANAFGQKYPVEYVLTNNKSQPGDSGAPVVTDAGCLAGILNGGNGEYSALTFLPGDVLAAAGL